MDSDLITKYVEIFSETVEKAFRNERPPKNRVLILQVEGYPGPGPYTEEQAEKLYRQCINEGHPWQDYPTVVHDVNKWYRSYMKAVKRGEVF